MERKVSIVVCTYNRRRMFNECLESLLNQSYPKDKYEIIVVDSSDDYSESLAENYKEKARKKGIELKYIYQKPSGISAARNLGIRNARGEIICFIDDDCIADRKWLEDLVRAFEEGVGGVGGNIVCVKPRTLIEKYCERNIPLDTRRRDLSYIPTCNAAYLKSLIENEIDTSLRNYGDRALSLKVQSKGFLLKHISSAVVFYRYRSDLMKLMIQFYYYGRGHVQFNRKYRYKSNKQFIHDLLSLKKKIILKVPQVLCRLFTAIGKKDKLLFVAEPLIDSLVYLSFLIGIVREILER